MIVRAKLNSDSVIVYRDRSGVKATEKQLSVLSQNWSHLEYNGFMSKSTRRKIVSMIQSWADSIYVKHRLSHSVGGDGVKKLRFLTLTLSSVQNMTDNEIKRRVLVPFISELKRRFGVKHYFWRAEAQKNGNIHFHLIIDEFIVKDEVNWLWDSHQALAGLIDSPAPFVGEYKSPSTRIEAVQGAGSVAGYVVKYVTKNDGGRKIFGRIWGCSDSLRNIGVPVIEYCNETAQLLEGLASKDESVKEINDFVVKFKVSVLRDERLNRTWLKDIVENYYIDIYDVLYNSDEL